MLLEIRGFISDRPEKPQKLNTLINFAKLTYINDQYNEQCNDQYDDNDQYKCDQDDDQDPTVSLSLFASAITPISNKQTHVCSTPTSLKYYYIH